MENKITNIVDDIMRKGSSMKYPKDLGYWGITKDKLDELERHLSKMVVEIKVYDMNSVEFPKLDHKNLYELYLRSDMKNKRKVLDELKRMKAFELDEHHVSNLKEKKNLEPEETEEHKASKNVSDAQAVANILGNDYLEPTSKEFKDNFTNIKSKTEGPNSDGLTITEITGLIKKEWIDKNYGSDIDLKKLGDSMDTGHNYGPGESFTDLSVVLKTKDNEHVSFSIYERSGRSI